MSEQPPPRPSDEELNRQALQVMTRWVTALEATDTLEPAVTYNQSQPGGTWNVERVREARKDRQSEHEQELERDRETHKLQQEAKDREVVRRIIYGLAAMVLAAFLYLGGLTLFADNDVTREWAQEALVVLFTATVSAVGGWFANRKSG